MTTAFQADAFQSDALAFQIDGAAPPVITGTQVPDGHRRKRKTLPYGWWAEADRPAEEIAQAEQALETARAEVRDTGEIAQSTVRRLDTALWFADVETKLTALEAAETKRKAQAELKAIAAELAQAKADYERALEEQDEEEAIGLLLSGSI